MTNTLRFILVAPFLIGFSALATAIWLALTGPDPGTGPAEAAARNFAIEHEIGRRIRIEQPDQRKLRTGPVVPNRIVQVPFSGQTLAVPEGFTATLFATGLANPRRLLVTPNGDILVAEQSAGQVTMLRADGEGRARPVGRVVEGLNRPSGLAWRGDHLLVTDLDGIWRMPITAIAVAVRRPVDGDSSGTRARADPTAFGARMLTEKGVFGGEAGHQSRPVAVEPGSGALFVGVGSINNLSIEAEPRATIQRFDAKGSNQSTFASGTRNPTTLVVHPQTGELWAGIQERDGLGDDMPADFLIRVRRGGFYGWPYAYLGPNPHPGVSQFGSDKVATTIVPDLLLQAHSSLIDMAFYEAGQFPDEYRGSLFVALRGSWNRAEPTGYKIVRVPFKDGRPEGHYENFATGFWAAGHRRPEVWGRPAAVAVAGDGALLVADDTGGTIWRIAYTGN